MKKKNAVTLFLFSFFYVSFISINAQVSPSFFKYQGVARDFSGAPMANHSISLKISIFSGSLLGALQWEEIHAITTDAIGEYITEIGGGITTGNGASASFSVIPWESAQFFLKVAVDYSGGTTYTDLGAAQLLSVPYSLYSQETKVVDLQMLNKLSTVDTNNIGNGKLLKWAGYKWEMVVDNDSDTTKFAHIVTSADLTDTAHYIKNGFIPTKDTVLFAFLADSSTHVEHSDEVKLSNHAVYTDTAVYAKSFLPYNWSINGNASTSHSFLGTLDTSTIVFKTRAVERIRITPHGKLGINSISPGAQLHLNATDGVIVQGVFGSGNRIDSTAGTKLIWNSKKAAICMGQVSENKWTSEHIGDYSFSFGLNTVASGIYSIAMGMNSTAYSESCISIGKNCTTLITGVVSDGAEIAMGDSCACNYTRGVAMGIKCFSSLPLGGIAMGYRNIASGMAACAAFGCQTEATGLVSIALGSYASNNLKRGTFIYGDATTTKVKNTTTNQFMVRASGGTVFYTDTNATMKVEILPGAGAWSNLTDSSKIENFRSENSDDILQKIVNMKIRSWNYKSQNNSTRHTGPSAQDFYAAFSLGNSNTTICTTDIDGVTLLGIKSLESKTSELIKKCNAWDGLELQLPDFFKSIEERINYLEQLMPSH